MLAFGRGVARGSAWNLTHSTGAVIGRREIELVAGQLGSPHGTRNRIDDNRNEIEHDECIGDSLMARWISLTAMS